MGGPLPDPQAPLTPDDARQLFDEVLFGRPLRVVLAYERFEQRSALREIMPVMHCSFWRVDPSGA